MVIQITQVGSFLSGVWLGMGMCLARTLPRAYVKYVPVICGQEVSKFAFHKYLFQQLKSTETPVGNEFEKKYISSIKKAW